MNVGCTAAVPPDATDMPAGCILGACTGNSCVPVACIPQACLAPGVTTAALASYQIFPNVPAADLLSPEQGLYNLLNIYFTGTPVASSFGGTAGTAPLNYLQVYSEDIQYASANTNTAAHITEAGGVTVSYFEWVQDRGGYFWTEDVVNDRLTDIMTRSFADVLKLSTQHKVNMRTAAYMLSISRVATVHRLRGIYA